MADHTNGTIQAAAQAQPGTQPGETPPEVSLETRRPLERQYQNLRRTRQWLLVTSLSLLGLTALTTYLAPSYDWTNVLAACVCGLVAGFNLGLRTGMGETLRTLGYVIRHIRRQEDRR